MSALHLTLQCCVNSTVCSSGPRSLHWSRFTITSLSSLLVWKTRGGYRACAVHYLTYCAERPGPLHCAQSPVACRISVKIPAHKQQFGSFFNSVITSNVLGMTSWAWQCGEHWAVQCWWRCGRTETLVQCKLPFITSVTVTIQTPAATSAFRLRQPPPPPAVLCVLLLP